MKRGERDLSSTLLFYFNRPTTLLLEKKLQSTFSTLIGFLYKELCKFLYIIPVRNFCLYELNLWYLNRHILIYGRVYFHYDYSHILDFRIFRNRFYAEIFCDFIFLKKGWWGTMTLLPVSFWFFFWSAFLYFFV